MSTRIRQCLLLSAAVVIATATAWLAKSEAKPETHESPGIATAPSSARGAGRSLASAPRVVEPPAFSESAPAPSPPSIRPPGDDSPTIAAAYELARTQPAEAAARLSSVRQSAERDAAIVHALGQWATLDVKGSKASAMSLPVGELRESCCGAIATAWADKDPRGAADWVATQMREGVAQRNAAVAVAQRWVQVAPEPAAAWALQFPAAEFRHDAMDALLRIWWSSNPAAVEKWMSGIPAEALRETREILGAIRAENPANRSAAASTLAP